MAKKIVIDGYIGSYGYSKQYVREMLKGEKGEVNVTLSSLGGDVDHAIDIHNQFREHGNVVVTMSGFNASSSTIIAMGAKKIIIVDNSFFLIHKALMWVDEFGYFNDDDFDSLIEKLEKKKDTAAKVSLTIAKIYAERTGMSIKDTLDLMKQEIWMTAQEAFDKNFAEEVYKPEKVENYLENEKMVAMLVASGFQVPGREKPVETPVQNLQSQLEENLFSRITNWIKEHFSPNSNTQNPKNNMSKPDLKRLLKAAKVENFTENSDGSITLTAEVAQAIESALEAHETAQAGLQKKVDDSSQLQAKVTNLENDIKTKDQRIAELEKDPGADPASVTKETDGNGGEGGAEESFFNRFSRLSNTKK